MNTLAAVVGQVVYDVVKHLVCGALAPGHDDDLPVPEVTAADEVLASLDRIETLLRENNSLTRRSLSPNPSRTGW